MEPDCSIRVDRHRHRHSGREAADSSSRNSARSTRSSTRRHEGTGLGLAITVAAGRSDGRRDRRRKRRRRGLDVLVHRHRCPCSDRPQATQIVPVDVTGARVLIVDDNAGQPRDPDRADGSLGLRLRCAPKAAPRASAFLDRAAPVRRPGRLRHARLPDARHDRRRRGQGIVARQPAIAPCRSCMLTSVDQSISAAWCMRFRHRRAADQAGALVGAARHASSRSSRRHRAPGGKAHSSAQPVACRRRCGRLHRASARPAMPPRSHRNAARHAERSPLDILVAEDNEVNQLVFTQILSGLGLQLSRSPATAAPRSRCTARCSRKLILMDVSMPEMNGYRGDRAPSARSKPHRRAHRRSSASPRMR